MRKALFSSLLIFTGLICFASPARAQTDGECGTGFCGTPNNNGGGGGGGGGGSILVNNTDIGITYSTSDDYDGDGFEDDYDNCPFRPNREQADGDGDGVGDVCDNCKAAANRDQADTDGDAIGDVCDADKDNDGKPNGEDNCELVPNKAQANLDGDTMGDACDDDIDGDGVPNKDDLCPFKPGVTTACDDDTDQDGIPDATDNCPLAVNALQKDQDKDGIGDNCDPDADNDLVPNGNDNCPLVANADQLDEDRDGIGDACDTGFCLVVPQNPDPALCLDPNREFQVVGGPKVLAKPGDVLTLSMFANRPGVNFNYKWNVISSPSGAGDTVKNPAGVATCTDGYECGPADTGKRPSFVPTHPGTYTLTFSADLEQPSAIEPQVMHASNTLVVTVEGDATSDGGGCQFGHRGGAAGLGFLGISLGIYFLSRRRR